MVRQSRTKVPVENLVTLAEAAVRFGVSVKTLRRRISDGTVTGYRVGRLIRVDMKELEEKKF